MSTGSREESLIDVLAAMERIANRIDDADIDVSSAIGVPVPDQVADMRSYNRGIATGIWLAISAISAWSKTNHAT